MKQYNPGLVLFSHDAQVNDKVTPKGMQNPSAQNMLMGMFDDLNKVLNIGLPTLHQTQKRSLSA